MRRFLMVLIVVALATSGCSDDSATSTGEALSTTTGPRTTATTGPRTTATTGPRTTTTTAPLDAAVATTVAPVVYAGGATYVSGRIADFALSEGTVTANSDGTSQSRDGSVSYTVISNDDRVAGTVTGNWHSDRWGPRTNAAIVQWGEATISNENGTWEATYDGFWTSSAGDVITRWWEGAGDYEGLTFYMAATGVSAWEWVGLIYPGDPPPQP